MLKVFKYSVIYFHGFAIDFFVLAGFAISDHLGYTAVRNTDDFKEANMKASVKNAKD